MLPWKMICEFYHNPTHRDDLEFVPVSGACEPADLSGRWSAKGGSGAEQAGYKFDPGILPRRVASMTGEDGL